MCKISNSLRLILIFLLSLVSSNFDTLNPSYNEIMYPMEGLVDPSSLYPLGGPLPTTRVFHTVAISSNLVVIYGGLSTDGTILDVRINSFIPYIVNTIFKIVLSCTAGYTLL